MIMKIILLVGLTRLLAATGNFLLCSGIYTGIAFFLAVLFTELPFLELLASCGIIFCLSTLYFYLLHRFDDSIVLYLLILVGGLAIGLV